MWANYRQEFGKDVHVNCSKKLPFERSADAPVRTAVDDLVRTPAVFGCGGERDNARL